MENVLIAVTVIGALFAVDMVENDIKNEVRKVQFQFEAVTQHLTR